MPHQMHVRATAAATLDRDGCRSRPRAYAGSASPGQEDQAAFLDERGDTERADFARRESDLERDAAREEWDRADAIQGVTQLTEPKVGDPVEIPIPTRDAFLRNLDKVAPPEPRHG
jgi:hypothetical protein